MNYRLSILWTAVNIHEAVIAENIIIYYLNLLYLITITILLSVPNVSNVVRMICKSIGNDIYLILSLETMA